MGGSVGIPELAMFFGRLVLHGVMQQTLRRFPYSPAAYAVRACSIAVVLHRCTWRLGEWVGWYLHPVGDFLFFR